MDARELVGDFDLASMFMAGAASAVAGTMSRDEAGDFVSGLCKQAAKRLRSRDDEDEDEDDTFWKRNKHWLIPSIVGGLAFMAGGQVMRYGRRDRGPFRNAWDALGRIFTGHRSPEFLQGYDRTYKYTPEWEAQRPNLLTPQEAPSSTPKHEDQVNRKYLA